MRRLLCGARASALVVALVPLAVYVLTLQNGLTPGELRGGDPQANAAALRAVLAGTDGGHRSAVILNAAGGIAAAGHAEDLREGIAQAREAINSGAAAARLDELVEFSRQ